MNENLKWLYKFDHKWYMARRSGYDCQEEYCNELCDFCTEIGMTINQEKKQKDFIDFTEELLKEAMSLSIWRIKSAV